MNIKQSIQTGIFLYVFAMALRGIAGLIAGWLSVLADKLDKKK